MSFCTACETDWILGTTGDCISEANETCECPEGFNGVEFWEDDKDCHSSVSVRQNMHITLAISSAIFFILSLISLYYSAKLLKRYKLKARVIFSRLSKHNLSSNIIRPLRADRGIVIASIFISLAAITHLGENLYFSLTSEVLESLDIRYPQSFFFGLQVLSLHIMGAILVLAMYHCLPDPEYYGELLGLSSCIIKYPNLPYKIIYFGLLLAFIVFAIFLIIQPVDLFQVSPIKYNDLATLITFISYLTFFIYIISYGYNLLKLYKSFLKIETDRTSSLTPIAATTGDRKNNKSLLINEIKHNMKIVKALVGLILFHFVFNVCIAIVVSRFNRYEYIARASNQFLLNTMLSAINLILIYHARQGRNPLKIRMK